MDLMLKDNVALITGAANGIGLASAKAFAQEGASLVLWDISPKVKDVALELEREFTVKVSAQIVDTTDLQCAVDAFSDCVSSRGRVHHVVHCAAIGSGKFGFPFTKLQPKDWNRTLEINIMGMVNVAHVVTPHFVAHREGTFVFLASVAGQIGSQTDPPYSASKAANINFAQCMAKDLATHNVRVNTVCPGMVQTTLNRSVWEAWHNSVPESEKLSYEEWSANKIRNVVPLGRWQSSEDIASMIVFLSSVRANQVTGQTINVDGGFVMHW
jgi:2-hydroxycyclohexanecarboxyl-CoA dehydrogenase